MIRPSLRLVVAFLLAALSTPLHAQEKLPPPMECEQPQILVQVLIAEIDPSGYGALPSCCLDKETRMRKPRMVAALAAKEQDLVANSLRTLKEREQLDVLSRPQIMTLNGQQAEVQIGSGDEGVHLRVRPEIKGDGIYLEFDFALSRLHTSSEESRPHRHSVRMNSSALVADGQTVFVHQETIRPSDKATRAAAEPSGVVVLLTAHVVANSAAANALLRTIPDDPLQTAATRK